MRKCKFNPKIKCDYYLKPCVECEVFRQIGQRTLMEYVPKPLINEGGTESQTGQFNARSNINGRATDSQGITVQVPSSGLCRECGRETSTGSQLFFICPLDGSWRAISDKCKFIESFEKTYGRKPNSEELNAYIHYIMMVSEKKL